MQRDPPRNLRILPDWVKVTAAILLLAAVAIVDLNTDPDLSLALFYFIPVAVATWTVGRGAGYIVSVASAVTWLCVDLHPNNSYRHISYAYWNALSRLLFFMFSVPILSSWRMLGDRLAKMVAERTAELTAEVAERQRAEKSLRQLAAQLSAAEDAERVRVAYDLHDGLGQMLSLLKMNLETTLAGSDSSSPQIERLTDAVRMVDVLISQTRSLTFDLHPSMLDDLGLVATLHGYARDFGQRTGIEVTVNAQGPAGQISKTLTHYLFRAVKELMSNAARHGKAKEIVIAVHWEAESLRVVVDDDGCGFEVGDLPQRKGPRGLGLPGITERLRSMGGDIHVESKPGQGTRAILEVPTDVPKPGTQSSPAAMMSAEDSL